MRARTTARGVVQLPLMLSFVAFLLLFSAHSCVGRLTDREKKAQKFVPPNYGSPDSTDDLDATYNLAALLSKVGDHATAAAHLAALLWREPLFVDAHVRLGLCKARLGDVDGARAAWRRAVDLDPNCAEARANLGLVTA